MKKTIYIHNTTENSRIGSTFNDVFAIIRETEEGNFEQVEWDFTHCSFLHPFFLAPLSLYYQRNKERICIVNTRYNIDAYLDVTHFHNPMELQAAGSKAFEIYKSKTYTPICTIPINKDEESQRMQSQLLTLIEHHIQKQEGKLKSPISYLMGELIDNVREHARTDKDYFYSQYLPSEKSLHIVIADQGATIFGSYQCSLQHLNLVTSEVQAIQQACAGLSTKGSPDWQHRYERGYGLNTSRNMVVGGMKGDFFLLSGKAFLQHTHQGERYVQLPEAYEWEGTIALLRIPIELPADFDYTRFLER